MTWIPVTDGLPKLEGVFPWSCVSDDVLITNGKNVYCGYMAKFGEEPVEWFDYGDDLVEGVTHWMPLPSLPEADDR